MDSIRSYAPGYGGIALPIGLEAPIAASSGTMSTSIAQPKIAPASNPKTFVTSGQQYQNVDAALLPALSTDAAPTTPPADSGAGGSIIFVIGIVGLFWAIHTIAFGRR